MEKQLCNNSVHNTRLNTYMTNMMITHIVSLLWLQLSLKIVESSFSHLTNCIWGKVSLCVPLKTGLLLLKPPSVASIKTWAVEVPVGKARWFIFISKAGQVSHLSWHPLELSCSYLKIFTQSQLPKLLTLSKCWFPLEILRFGFQKKLSGTCKCCKPLTYSKAAVHLR